MGRRERSKKGIGWSSLSGMGIETMKLLLSCAVGWDHWTDRAQEIETSGVSSDGEGPYVFEANESQHHFESWDLMVHA